jgi:SulP family sulfate permease
MARHVPILDWAPTYDRGWLRLDLIAGVTVAALVIPKALGYAGIANVPIENGLYAAAAGTILYALFGTSRQLSTGPSGALAAIAGSAVILSGVADEAVASALVAAVALAAGLVFLGMAILRMGWISQFMSKAVITGFLFGAAIDVAVGELPKLTGTSSEGSNVWQEFGSWVRTLGEVHQATLLVGIVALVALFGLKRFVPAIPGTLIVVIGGLLASAVLDLGAHGVALIGDVPRGLPMPAIPDLQLVSDNLVIILVAAIGIVAVGFSQTAGDARFFATKHGYRIDVNQETVAQGVANLGAGLFQGIPVSTSLSASSLSDNSGARSAVTSLTTGAVVILTLLVFAPVFSILPKAVLGAVIIEAVISGMIDIPEMRRLYRVKRFDFGIAVAAILGVLSFGVLAGIVIGVVLSLGWMVYVTATPRMPVLGRARGSHVFQELDAHPDGEQFPGILALRLDGGLFFATADALGDRIREVAVSADPPLTAVVLDCQGIDFIDSQGSAKLGESVELARANGIAFRLARVKPSVMEVLSRDGVLERVGADHIHNDVNEAVTAQLASAPHRGA